MRLHLIAEEVGLTGMARIRVLIADDHFVVRDGLSAMLESSDEFEVVGQAEDGQEAIQLTEELQPDVVLLDIQMPKLDGIEATYRIRRKFPKIQVVILSTFDQDEYVYQSLQAGAKGYVLKDSGLDELLAVVRAAARGESLLSTNITTKLVKYISTPRRGQRLTNREGEVLSLVAKGLRNRDIARRLCISEQTVKNHINHIITKLGVQSRTEAVSRALERKLIKQN
jgi:DNA-binding NarL/FixJ family response regulator